MRAAVSGHTSETFNTTRALASRAISNPVGTRNSGGLSTKTMS